MEESTEDCNTVTPTVTVTVNQQLYDLEERYSKLDTKVDKLSARVSSNHSSVDSEEEIMKWMAIIYVVSIIAPFVVRALASIFTKTDTVTK